MILIFVGHGIIDIILYVKIFNWIAFPTDLHKFNMLSFMKWTVVAPIRLKNIRVEITYKTSEALDLYSS